MNNKSYRVKRPGIEGTNSAAVESWQGENPVADSGTTIDQNSQAYSKYIERPDLDVGSNLLPTKPYTSPVEIRTLDQKNRQQADDSQVVNLT